MLPEVSQASGVALPVGDDPARLPHDERPGGDVPRPEAQLEVAVEHALGGPAQVEAGRPDPAEILERVDGGCRTRARSRASRSLRRNGKPVATIACSGARPLTCRRPFVAERAPAPARPRRCGRAAARARRRPPARRPATRPTETPTASKPCTKFDGAVERVDEPADVGAVAAFLLAEHGQPRLALEHDRGPRSRWRRRPSLTQSPGDFSRTLGRAEVRAHDLAAGVRGTVGERERARRDRDAS